MTTDEPTTTTTLGAWITDLMGVRGYTVKSFYMDGKLIHFTDAHPYGLKGRIHSAVIKDDGLHVYYDNGRIHEVVPLATAIDADHDVIRRKGYKREVQYVQVRLRGSRVLQRLSLKERHMRFLNDSTRGTYSVLDCKIVSNVQRVDLSLDGAGEAVAYVVYFLNGWDPVTFEFDRSFRVHGPHVYATRAETLATPPLQV
jgi:hypothetical protein